ncbi:MAG: DMT family transporter [Planctomycetota bacterium]
MNNSSDHGSSPPPQSYLPEITLVAVALIWGLNMPLMKLGLERLDNVYIFNALRLPLSAAVLAFFALRERAAGNVPKPGVTIKQLLVYAVMVAVVYQLSFLLGLNYTTPGNSALIMATVPMWTALLAWLFLGERIGKLAWLGLFIALTGTITVSLQKGVSFQQEHFVGNLIILLAALMWSGGTVYSRPLLNKISPMQLAAFATVVGLPFHLAVAGAHYDGKLSGLDSPLFWAVLIFSGSLSSGLTQPMWHFGVKQAGPSHAAIVQNLIPVFALLTVWVISGDAPTKPQIIGGTMILGGLIIMRISKRMQDRQLP